MRWSLWQFSIRQGLITVAVVGLGCWLVIRHPTIAAFGLIQLLLFIIFWRIDIACQPRNPPGG